MNRIDLLKKNYQRLTTLRAEKGTGVITILPPSPFLGQRDTRSTRNRV